MVEDIVSISLPLLLVLVGFGLTFAEALAPGAHLIVLGVALLVAGAVGLLVPTLAGPFALAVLVLLTGAVSLWVYREFDIYGGKGAGQTSDSASLTGQTGRVTQRVTPTSGEVKLDDGGFNPFYQARSFDDEIPEDNEVIVVDPGGGNVLTVESLDVLDDVDKELERHAESADAEQDAELESP